MGRKSRRTPSEQAYMTLTREGAVALWELLQAGEISQSDFDHAVQVRTFKMGNNKFLDPLNLHRIQQRKVVATA